MNLEKLKDKLKDKTILILGLGKEGRDTLRFLKKLFPKKVIGIADQKQFSIFNFQFSNIRWHLGENYLKSLKNYDIIIKSPGIPPKIFASQKLRGASRPKITSQTEIFFENCPGTIIGVTGTKGKGTTAALVYQILKKAGFRVHLVGNIGKPALSQLFKAQPNAIFVYELSSHQLYNLKKSPKIAVLLNIFPAHLEYFRNFKEYINTKANITRYQTKNDYLIYNPGNRIVNKIAKKSKAKKILISTKLPILRKIKSSLIGRFNLLNLATAVTVAKLFKILDKDIIKAVKNFKPARHRLEYVGTFKGIKFYNDSASTIPESAIGAIEALGEQLQTIILGGSECKISFQKLAKEILKSKIKTLILFPTTGRKIWIALRQAQGKKLPDHFFARSMREAVKLAYSHTKREGICLLSPASPSFTLFRDYKERGDLFKKYLKFYGRKRKKSS